jgi:hypothetical protein
MACRRIRGARSSTYGVNLRFYLNERPLSARSVSIAPDTIEIKLDLPYSGRSTPGLDVPPFSGHGRPPILRLPITRTLPLPADAAIRIR